MERTKFTGVYQHDAKSGNRTYYIQYKKNGKLIRQKVGSKAEGITPTYCARLREQTLVQLRLGDSAPIQNKAKIKTLDQVAKDYFDNNLSRSAETLRAIYSGHIEPELGSNLITDISEDSIAKFRKKKSKEISQKTKRVLAPKTVNVMLAILSAVTNYAVKKDYIKKVPEIEKIKANNVRDRYLSKDEVVQLIDTIEKSTHKLKKELLLFVKLSLRTGGRLGTILSIRGKDINRERKRVKLQNHKTGGTYFAFIPDSLMEDIPKLNPMEKLINVDKHSQIQFPLQKILNDLFNEDLEKDNRKERVVVHTLRHTFASHLAEAGVSIQVIMEKMDHANISMTLKYAKLTPDVGNDFIERLYT